MNAPPDEAKVAEILAALAPQAQEPQLWKRLEQFAHNLPRHRAHSVLAAAQSTRDKEDAMVANLLADVHLPLLFAAANFAFASGDDRRAKVAGEALTCVFGSATGARLALELPEVVPIMQAGLQHDPPALRRLTVGLVRAAAVEEPAGRPARCRALLSTPLPPLLVWSVADPSIAVAQAATECLVDMLRHASEPDTVAGTTETAVAAAAAIPAATGPDAMPASAAAATAAADAVMAAVAAAAGEAANSTITLRLAELAARCASLSDASFVAALSRGALVPLFEISHNSDDAMLRLNALELLELLAATPAGARFLFKEGHVAKLLALAGAGSGDASGEGNGGGGGEDPLLGGSALRVLGAIYRRASGMGAAGWAGVEPALARRFLRAVSSRFDARDEAGQLAALGAIASFAGSSVAALAAALEDEQLLGSWLSFGAFKVEVKAVALHSVANVLGPPPQLAPASGTEAAAAAAVEEDVNAAEERAALCLRLFEQVGLRNGGRPTGDYLVSLAKMPVPELRYAAIDVMRCAVHQRGGWGLRALFGSPGFRDILLAGGGAERERRGMEWRFSLVEAVAHSPDRTAVLGPETLAQLEGMLKDGPFRVRPVAAAPDVRTMA